MVIIGSPIVPGAVDSGCPPDEPMGNAVDRRLMTRSSVRPSPTGRVSSVSSLSSLFTGRRSKFLVLIFWLVVVGLAGPLSGKLTDAQENDTAAWLPGSAESTKVLEIQQSFQSPDAIPAVIVYERDGRADRGGPGQGGRGRAAVRRPARAPRASPPDRSRPRTGRRCRSWSPFDLGANGWDQAPGIAEQIRDDRRGGRPTASTMHVTGPVGHRRRLGVGVRGDRRHAAVRDPRRRRHHPAVHLPQPGAVAAAGALAPASRSPSPRR